MVARPAEIVLRLGPSVSPEVLEVAETISTREADALKKVVASEQVRLAYAQANVTMVAGVLVALVTVLATRDFVPELVAIGWCAAFLATTGLRWWLAFAYAREGRQLAEAPIWRRRWVASMFVIGSVWGVAGAIFPDANSPELTVFIAFILGGLTAGALATQTGIFAGFVAFVVPAFLPIIVWLAWQGSELSLWMGAMCALYGATMLITAHYYSQNFERSLSLGVENMGLVHELVDSNEIAQDTNRALEAEIVERTQTEEALRRSEEHFRNLIHGSIQGIALVRDWRVLFANDPFAQILGYDSADEVIGANVVEDFTPPDDHGLVYDMLANQYRGNRGPLTYEGRALRRDGQELFVGLSLHQVNWYGQRTTQITATDVSARRAAVEALRASEERFKDFAETAADWFYETDEALRYTYVSERFQQISGWHADEVIGRTQRELQRDSVEDPEKLERHYEELDEHRAYQVDLLSAGKDGNLYVFHYAGKPIYREGGEFVGYRGAGRDVTQAYQLSKQLSYQATHDALTGLLNRRAFEQRLERVLSSARQDGSTHALCYLDLDQFKVVNDTCGHMAGDELLRQLGRMLPSYIRKRDTLARLGGDEFGVLMEHCSLEQAERVARALCRAVEEYQYVWEGHTFRVGCSIGLVPISGASDSGAAVMSSADTACYAAKDEGRRRVHVYHPGDEEHAKRYGEMQWAVRINRALEEDRFRLVYQSIAPVNVPTAERQLNLLNDEPPWVDDGLHLELLIRLEEYDGTLTLTWGVPPSRRAL